MDSNKLYNSRTHPCLNELYYEAECLNGEKYDFDTVSKYSPKNEQGRTLLPTGAFYIDRKKFDEIIGKYCKGLPYYWRFPYRSEIYPKGEEWKTLQREYKKNPKDPVITEEYEQAVEYRRRDKLWKEYHSQLTKIEKDRKDKKITGPEAKKLKDKLAKKYECQRRSNERESLQLICAFYGPTIVRGYYDKVKMYYDSARILDNVERKENDYSLAIDEADYFKEFENNYNSRQQ